MSFSRKTPRADLDIYLNKFIDGVPYLCRSTDISEEGMYLGSLIEPQEPVIHGQEEQDGSTLVGLQFQLPGTEEVIYAEGELVRFQERRRSDGYGVRFTHLAPRHKALINQYVRRALAA